MTEHRERVGLTSATLAIALPLAAAYLLAMSSIPAARFFAGALLLGAALVGWRILGARYVVDGSCLRIRRGP
jgi:hypothetical protein